MKKITFVVAAAAASVVHAGSMGPVSTSSSTPYLTSEASYTWPPYGGFTVNSYQRTISSQGWGGRLGAGMMYSYSETISLTGEIGGGYYGSKSQNLYNVNGQVASSGSFSVDGYDVLAGFIYKLNYFDVFFQGGFMLENIRTSYYNNLSDIYPGGLYSGFKTRSLNQTQALPEIKVGGIYNVNPNWGIDVAYMHVFGNNNPHGSGQKSATFDGVYENTSVFGQNPTLDSVMFGLHYNFVM